MVFVAATALMFSLEAVDFVPYFWLVDAHSLWHLATALIAPVFYSFLVDDARYCVRSMEERARFSCHPDRLSCAHCAPFLERWQAIDDDAATKAKADAVASFREAQKTDDEADVDVGDAQKERDGETGAKAKDKSSNAKH